MKRDDGEGLECRLTERDREVEVLALVMNGVNRPQEVGCMARSMPPVIEEIDSDQADEPRGEAPFVERDDPVAIDRGIEEDAHPSEERVDQLRDETRIEICDCRAKAVASPLLLGGSEALHEDGREKHGHRSRDEVEVHRGAAGRKGR